MNEEKLYKHLKQLDENNNQSEIKGLAEHISDIYWKWQARNYQPTILHLKDKIELVHKMVK